MASAPDAVRHPQVRLQALAAILDEAVHAQPSADRAVAACGEPGPVPMQAIQQVAERIADYHHLIVRLRALDLGSGLLPLASGRHGCWPTTNGSSIRL